MDTTLIKSQDGGVDIIGYKGSTIKFVLDQTDNQELLQPNIIIKANIKPDINSVKVADFVITKTSNSIIFSIPYNVSEQLQPLDGYKTVQAIIKNKADITVGKYYYDVEVFDTNSNEKYKLFFGNLFILPEVTTD